jgi:hypothetical protein
MVVITDAPYLDEQTGMLVEIVRDAETGEIIGKNERMPEEAPE